VVLFSVFRAKERHFLRNAGDSFATARGGRKNTETGGKKKEGPIFARTTFLLMNPEVTRNEYTHQQLLHQLNTRLEKVRLGGGQKTHRRPARQGQTYGPRTDQLPG
jgi:hypothetical protein